MPSHKSAKHAINKQHKRHLMLFHCKMPNCCNFISSIESNNRLHCRSHKSRCGSGLLSATKKAIKIKPEIKRFIMTKDIISKDQNKDNMSVVFGAKIFADKLVIASNDKNEVCGLMFGKDNNVMEIAMVPNEKPSPVYFEFSSMKAGEVIFEAMQRGLKMLGVFHSHPMNQPNPSMTDYDYMEAHPGIWTIYSPRFKKWASWIRIGDKIHPVDTVIRYEDI